MQAASLYKSSTKLKLLMIAVIVAGIGISAYYAGQHNLKLEAASTPQRADRQEMVRFRGAWTPSPRLVTPVTLLAAPALQRRASAFWPKP